MSRSPFANDPDGKYLPTHPQQSRTGRCCPGCATKPHPPVLKPMAHSAAAAMGAAILRAAMAGRGAPPGAAHAAARRGPPAGAAQSGMGGGAAAHAMTAPPLAPARQVGMPWGAPKEYDSATEDRGAKLRSKEQSQKTVFLHSGPQSSAR